MKVEAVESRGRTDRVELVVRYNPHGDPQYIDIQIHRNDQDEITFVSFRDKKITQNDIAILNILTEHDYLPNNWMRFNGKEEAVQ